jgi:hypothetical protein
MDVLELTNSEPAPSDNGSLGSKSDFMSLRKPREALRDRLITVQADHSAIDNLIRGLVDLLPNPEGVWPLEDRAKWLRLAAGIFDLGYKAGEGGENRQISIAVVRSDVASS